MLRKPHVRGELPSFDDLSDEIADDVLASNEAVEARERLVHFLDQAHTNLPEVTEDEAAPDYKEAIRVVRASA